MFKFFPLILGDVFHKNSIKDIWKVKFKDVSTVLRAKMFDVHLFYSSKSAAFI